MKDSVNVYQKLSLFHDHWAPRTIATMNDLAVMVVKVDGEFKWHHHPDTDDFFLVLEGELEIGLREPVGPGSTELHERAVILRPGDLYIVPKGVEHRPAARKGEVKIILMEPKGMPNTGDVNTAAPYQEI